MNITEEKMNAIRDYLMRKGYVLNSRPFYSVTLEVQTRKGKWTPKNLNRIEYKVLYIEITLIHNGKRHEMDDIRKERKIQRHICRFVKNYFNISASKTEVDFRYHYVRKDPDTWLKRFIEKLVGNI